MLCLTHLFFAGRQDGLSDRIGDDPTGKARRVAGLGSIGLTLGTREGSVAEHDALEIPDTNGVASTALIVDQRDRGPTLQRLRHYIVIIFIFINKLLISLFSSDDTND
jgi:hypothetical protein